LLLRDLDWPAMAAALGRYGVGEVVARKAFSRVHRLWATDLDDLDRMSAEARAEIRRDASFPDLEIVERRRAADGFVKYLFRLDDGGLVEAVRIPLPDPDDARDLHDRRRKGEVDGLVALPTAKYTLCISSQAGCALGCAFCATGKLGFSRNLATWEMLAQVHAMAREADHPARGVLFLGMGEPLLNYDNVIRAARILSDPAGLAISADAISLSTAGVVPAIRRFTAEGHKFRLIVSLAAATPERRRLLMPIEKTWPLDELVPAIREYAAANKGRVTLAYVAVSGANMDRQAARELARLFDGVKIKVNLIDVNDAEGSFVPPRDEEIAAFRDELSRFSIPLVRRYAGGRDIGAACGTLAATRNGGEVIVPWRSHD
jgi:23S rRNA (adenine2503-C2)-methyltransferase